MRARSAFFAGAGSVAILAIGWQAGVGALVSSLPTSAPAASGTSGTTGTTSGSSAGTANTGTVGAPNGSGAGVTDGTFDGQTISTRFGTVQVQAVIAGGQITDVIAVKLTDNERKSAEISNQAAPLVRSEVLTAQSARVSNISGATYTTQAYLQSLQSALDAAGFTG
jgi:uncharacterized protein with FMN-binding domain